jgi:hypothetical protein
MNFRKNSNTPFSKHRLPPRKSVHIFSVPKTKVVKETTVYDWILKCKLDPREPNIHDTLTSFQVRCMVHVGSEINKFNFIRCVLLGTLSL